MVRSPQCMLWLKSTETLCGCECHSTGSLITIIFNCKRFLKFLYMCLIWICFHLGCFPFQISPCCQLYVVNVNFEYGLCIYFSWWLPVKPTNCAKTVTLPYRFDESKLSLHHQITNQQPNYHQPCKSSAK